MIPFFTIEYALGLATGVCGILSAWASEKAFGKWYIAGLLILGIDLIKKEKSE